MHPANKQQGSRSISNNAISFHGDNHYYITYSKLLSENANQNVLIDVEYSFRMQLFADHQLRSQGRSTYGRDVGLLSVWANLCTATSPTGKPLLLSVDDFEYCVKQAKELITITIPG